MTGLRFGQAAPSFTLPSSAGGEASLADFKGKDVVLVFYCYDWGGIWTPELSDLGPGCRRDHEARRHGGRHQR